MQIKLIRLYYGNEWVSHRVFRSNTESLPQGRLDMEFILWLLAVILVVSGIIALTRRQILYGILLIAVGLLVGPGGVSIFS